MTRFGYDSDSSASSLHSVASTSSSASTAAQATPAPYHYASSSDEDDSEEETWPVGPPGSIGLSGWNSTKGKARAQRQGNALPSAVGRRDNWEDWEAKEKATTWVRRRIFFKRFERFEIETLRTGNRQQIIPSLPLPLLLRHTSSPIPHHPLYVRRSHRNPIPPLNSRSQHSSCHPRPHKIIQHS